MTTTVSGPLFDEAGEALANVTCTIIARGAVTGQDGGLRARRGVVVETDGSGDLEVELKPGEYDLFVQVPVTGGGGVTVTERASMTVNDQEAQTLQSALQGGGT